MICENSARIAGSGATYTTVSYKDMVEGKIERRERFKDPKDEAVKRLGKLGLR